MEEESNFDVLLRVPYLLAQHLRKQHQVVVVDPNHVAILHILDDCLGEQPVNLLIGRPRRFVKSDLSRVVVEKWPEDRVCDGAARLLLAGDQRGF